MEHTGIVINIQRFTIHDGPGLRTEFFLKGCELRCKWCSNPESWNPKIQYGVYNSKCITKEKCGACIRACKNKDTVKFDEEGRLNWLNNANEEDAQACYDACPSDAIKQWGKVMTVEDCMKIIRKDKGYYERSGGGVTVSGGDPIMQADFVKDLYTQCKKEGYSTCFESTFHGDWERIEKILPVSDLLISDLKHVDPEVHKKYTGVSNEKILANLKKICELDKPLILRIPLIPGVNDTDENIKASADFIVNELHNNVRTLQLLSFMRLGEEKYESLSIPYGMEGVEVDRKTFTEHVRKIADYFNSRGIHCTVGTKEKE